MKKLVWLFITLISFNLVSSCGLKGPLYFSEKSIEDKKSKNIVSPKKDVSINTDKILNK
ncbi:MAG: LPS translocon maturation chaperone LptM [Arsenophonus sp. ER-QC15-MAG3]